MVLGADQTDGTYNIMYFYCLPFCAFGACICLGQVYALYPI